MKKFSKTFLDIFIFFFHLISIQREISQFSKTRIIKRTNYVYFDFKFIKAYHSFKFVEQSNFISAPTNFILLQFSCCFFCNRHFKSFSCCCSIRKVNCVPTPNILQKYNLRKEKNKEIYEIFLSKKKGFHHSFI